MKVVWTRVAAIVATLIGLVCQVLGLASNEAGRPLEAVVYLLAGLVWIALAWAVDRHTPSSENRGM
ncbi:MAG: hypothetical protein E6261_05900 [Cutibacterium avidum]|nr:hypothetical protein [Cutibacterium avidum]